MWSLSWQYAAILPLVLITLYSFINNRDKKGRKYVFPPGPKGLPIAGNSFQLPPFGASALTKKWAEQYGEMYSLEILELSEGFAYDSGLQMWCISTPQELYLRFWIKEVPLHPHGHPCQWCQISCPVGSGW